MYFLNPSTCLCPCCQDSRSIDRRTAVAYGLAFLVCSGLSLGLQPQTAAKRSSSKLKFDVSTCSPAYNLLRVFPLLLE